MSSIEDKEKQKSKKRRNIMIIVSSIIVVIPVVFALLTVFGTETTLTQKITEDDFPLEMFDQGYDILCLDKWTCIIKNDGNVQLKSENGIYIFQTKDFSLMKHYDKQTGTEEISISYAFYEKGIELKHIGTNAGYEMWLVKAEGK